MPPTTSNKRVDGERAYRKAHRGESFELPPSRVYLHEARFISHRLPASSKLLLVTGGGYYVRSLVRDLGRATGALAHLAALRRTAIGPWEDPPPGQRVWLRGAELFPWCATLPVDAADAKALRAHRAIPRRPVEPPSWALPAGFPIRGRPSVRCTMARWWPCSTNAMESWSGNPRCVALYNTTRPGWLSGTPRASIRFAR